MTDNNINTETLKNQALLERIAEITAESESKIADLRVAYTVLQGERDALAQQVEDLSSEQTN